MSTVGPPDPFMALNPQERRRFQETVILEMAYDLSLFQSVTPRERPDFALKNQSGGALGVEITQLFVNESQARLNLVPGYANRLWAGGPHMHKKDIKALRATTVSILSKEGKLRHAGVPAIFTDAPTVGEFRSRLYETIQTKSARGYDSGDFIHLNLVIHDWFNLPFDANEYSIDRFFDNDIRTALRTCVFREVLLIVYNTAHNTKNSSGGAVKPDARVIPLQQLLAMERFYVTVRIIDQECNATLRDVAELNRATIDHISRIQGYGVPAIYKERLFLCYGESLIQIGDSGIRVHESINDESIKISKIDTRDRMELEAENRVSKRVDTSVFRCGYAPLANRPRSWG